MRRLARVARDQNRANLSLSRIVHPILASLPSWRFKVSPTPLEGRDRAHALKSGLALP